jgi:membrane fusion protein (multidrug efflux system)
VFEAVVTYIAPQIDPQTRSLPVKAVLKEVENPPRLGASVSAEVVADQRQDRPYVPERALVATRKGYTVYLVGPEKTAERKDVETGIRRAGIVEITEGLSAGQTIIVAGQEKLSAGRAVRVVEPEGDDNEPANDSDRGGAQ